MPREKKYNYQKTGAPRLRATTRDKELMYAVSINPELEEWRSLGVAWVAGLKTAVPLAMTVMKQFMVDYLNNHNLEMRPSVFLSRGHKTPCFGETCLSHLANPMDVSKRYFKLCEFLDYVILNNFSIEDDNGVRHVPSEIANPLPKPAVLGQAYSTNRSESDKEVLPFKYIAELKGILCPIAAKSFSDWKWAISMWDKGGQRGGDWFEVDPSIIDKSDPDCVFRVRTIFTDARKTKSKQITEMWYPGRAVALYFKLELPLRTYQVRMLDSGEADTYIFDNGNWIANPDSACKGTERKPFSQGFLRKITDPVKGLTMTGLFINTNKTADVNKSAGQKGYTIPWEHTRVIYWTERLRNWQRKYNPIDNATPWTSLTGYHLGSIKADSVLQEMGEACFLFRDARLEGNERNLPIPGDSPAMVWRKLLEQLESNCADRGETALNGAPLKFVSESPGKTYYPLHSLRVSLITAFALEGGVPMPILSKCIAGHSRLLMTLYYTKAGISYISDQMNDAEQRLIESEKDNFNQWLRNATYEQLELNGAYTDPVAIKAVYQAQNSGASLVRDSRGICPKGGMACDSGGVYLSDDSDKVTYGPVQGYPEKNCPRCRWFFTGPAFLSGLVSHWNLIHLRMGDNGQFVANIEKKISSMEDEKFHAQSSGVPFTKQIELDSLNKSYQAAIELNDKYANDSTATLRLIVRAKQLLANEATSEGVSLVAVGSREDVRVSIAECSKLESMLSVANAAHISIETDIGKTLMEAGRAYDLMLSLNGARPLFFELEGSELEDAVHQMSNLLRAETGSISNAIPFIEGLQRLEELGIDVTTSDFANNIISFQGERNVRKLSLTANHD